MKKGLKPHFHLVVQEPQAAGSRLSTDALMKKGLKHVALQIAQEHGAGLAHFQLMP